MSVKCTHEIGITIVNARRMPARVTVVCLCLSVSLLPLYCQHTTCVQQIELARQVLAELQRFSTDGFARKLSFPSHSLFFTLARTAKAAIFNH